MPSGLDRIMTGDSLGLPLACQERSLGACLVGQGHWVSCSLRVRCLGAPFFLGLIQDWRRDIIGANVGVGWVTALCVPGQKKAWS